MDFERLNGDIKDMRRRNRGLALTVGALAGGHVLALVVILNLLGSVRTVVVPPSINKSFWVTRDKASSEYLEQMGSFIAWLVLDVTPASVDWKKDILLGYVEPEQHGELRTRQDLEAARLKRINASTFFMPQQLVPSEDAQTVVVRGRLSNAGPLGPSANHVRAMKAMLVAMASDRVPADMRVDEVNRPMQLWAEARFSLMRRYEGRGLLGEKYLLQNVSSAVMVLAEQEFDREDSPAGGQVVGVAVENHNLRPGESTNVFVIRRGGAR